MTRPTHDLVVFGATSFVGQILARYLAEYLSGSGETLRWAIAGRSEAKLRQVRDTLGAAGQSVPIIVAADGAARALLRANASGRVHRWPMRFTGSRWSGSARRLAPTAATSPARRNGSSG